MHDEMAACLGLQRHFGVAIGQTEDKLGDDPDEDPGEWTEHQIEHLKELYERHGTIDQ